MQINGSERDTVRLFHLDLPREAVERFVTQAGTGEWPLKYALGATVLRTAFVDVVDIRDLGQMSLSQYMTEAHGASGDDFRQMRNRIDALTGHVVILPAQAFDNTSQTLSIATPLRWIGTFAETRAKPKGARLQSDAARGALGGQPAPAGTGGSGLLRLIALAVAIVVVLVVALALR
ncbi:aspartate carbamoyltransferase catalytic subunit [Aestuariicoccus sp. KMU-90]|uniref:Aspartate carbamoyltransferase catalytic subunit n=2 Tax=Thetidibacter halocola TaxID=2827239 RepID=A0A8J7WJB5_9RHOB|nr:aspartate carbamoyltransferase catalytic subunit [Thetidibacter halocola]